MHVQFTRRPDHGTVAQFSRRDGVRIRVGSSDRTGPVPHAPPVDPDAAVRTALAELTDLQRRWAGLPTGGTFDLDWLDLPGRRRAPRRPIR